MPPGEEDAADRFYAGVLGMTRVAKPSRLAGRGGCWFEIPGAQVHLGVEEHFSPARKAHPAFVVESLESLAERLIAHGHEVIRDTQLKDHRRFYSTDPFGNRLEFLERR